MIRLSGSGLVQKSCILLFIENCKRYKVHILLPVSLVPVHRQDRQNSNLFLNN